MKEDNISAVLVLTSFSILIGVALAFVFLDHHQIFDDYQFNFFSSLCSSLKSINK